MMTRRSQYSFGLVLLSLLFVAAYAVWSAEPESTPQGSAPAPLTGRDQVYDDYARFIAGVAKPGSSLASCEKQAAWSRYAAVTGRNWTKFDQRQLEPMREWAGRELKDVDTATVFYPFSGPDFLNVYTLFPRARTYVLVALEPPGSLPDFAAVDLGSYFDGLQGFLHDCLSLDFFITAKMKSNIDQSALKGVLPVLLFFLGREQARVQEVYSVVLQPDGTMAERSAAAEDGLSGGVPGLRLVFTGPGSEEKQTIYYFSVNLQNAFLGRNQQFVAFLKGLGPLTTFTKSASYLLFSPNSTNVRQLILERSRYVLQDDSGIPLRSFTPDTWKLRFYGTYTRPIPLFTKKYQPDLAAAYQGKDVSPLPFGIGYCFRPNTSNLIFAAKKSEDPEK